MVQKWKPKQIRALRDRHGETQEVFCKRLGVSLVTYRFWENGRHPPMGPARLLLDRIELDLDAQLSRTVQLSAGEVANGVSAGEASADPQVAKPARPDKQRGSPGNGSAARPRGQRTRKRVS